MTDDPQPDSLLTDAPQPDGLATDDTLRQRATDYILQQYHLTDLQEARQKLTPTQFEGVLRQIDALIAQVTAPSPPSLQPGVRGVQPGARGLSTPFGPVLPVTGLLLVAIWIMFILESVQPRGSTDPGVLTTFGATTPDTLASGQYWRLLAACFLHIGVVHIVSNSIALIWLGSLAERLFGSLRFAAVYLAAGVIGNVAAVAAQGGGAGASGAIFGLLGALLIGTWRNRRVLTPQARQQITSGIASMLVLNLAISFLPGIGWSAHIGGAIVGAVLALFITYRSPGEPSGYARAVNLLSVILIVASLGVLATYPGAH